MPLIKISKTVNETVENTLRKALSAIKELGFELEGMDSKAGTITFWKYTLAQKYKYQCVVFDVGDGSTMCTIRTIGYTNDGPLASWWDSMNLGYNSRKHSQKILDRL